MHDLGKDSLVTLMILVGFFCGFCDLIFHPFDYTLSSKNLVTQVETVAEVFPVYAR